MNYFEFYQLPVDIWIDLTALRNRFIAKSKEFHPDFHSATDVETQMAMLEMSGYNNKAYTTLSDFDKRVKYLLDLFEVPVEQAKLPPEFLMEMMEYNELILDIKSCQSIEKVKTMEARLQVMLSELKNDLLDKIDNFSADPERYLPVLKSYYLKSRYLYRLIQQLKSSN